MADLRLLVDVLTKGTGDLKKLNRDLKDTGIEAEKTSSKLGTIGKAIGAFAAGFVAFKAVDFLGDSVKAALDEEKAVAALTAAIEANDAANVDNIDGIEATIKARQRLAFADDEQRESLAGLVSVTQDTTKALELQRTAMDLARLKNISLKTASDLLGKVYAGNLGTLSRYGIVLEEGTTATEALAEIQRRASGQAEKFADTTAGSMQAMQLALDDVQEDIGKALLPILKDLSEWVLEDGVPALNILVDGLEHVGTVAEGVAGVFRFDFFGGAGPIGDFTDDVNAVAITLQDAGIAAEEARPLFDKFGDDIGEVREELDRWESAGTSVEDGLAAITDGFHETSRSTRDFRADLSVLADTVDKEWERIAAEPVSQMSAQADEIRDAAFNHQVQYAKGLADGMNEPLVQMEALQQLQEESLSTTAEIARLQGQLTSSELAAGLADTRPAVRAQAEATRLAIVNQLASLGVDAFNWGYGIASELALGMKVGRGQVIQGAAQLGGAIRSQIGVESEPSDPNSPLHGITQWGLNIAKTLQEGMSAGVRLVKDGSALLASAIAPGTLQAVTAAPGASAGGVPAVGGGITIILQNLGDPITEDDDVLESLRLLVPHIRDAVASD